MIELSAGKLAQMTRIKYVKEITSHEIEGKYMELKSHEYGLRSCARRALMDVH